jgi:hypothetical protein
VTKQEVSKRLTQRYSMTAKQAGDAILADTTGSLESTAQIESQRAPTAAPKASALAPPAASAPSWSVSVYAVLLCALSVAVAGGLAFRHLAKRKQLLLKAQAGHVPALIPLPLAPPRPALQEASRHRVLHLGMAGGF